MIQRGGPERYTVSYDVTNHRDSIAFAHLIWTDQGLGPSGMSSEPQAQAAATERDG